VSSYLRLLPEAILSLGATALLVVGTLGPQRQMREFLRWLSLLLLALTVGALITARETAVPIVDGWTVIAPIGTAFAVAILALVGVAIVGGRAPIGGAGEWFSLLLFVALGGLVLSRAGNLAALFLGVEVLSIALYVLISFFYTRRSSLRAGAMYLALAGFASAFLLFGMALVYAVYGTMNVAELHWAVTSAQGVNALALVGFAMFLVGVGFKLSLVPFHMWAADVYESSPATVAGVIASASKGAIVAAFIPFAFVLHTHWWMLAVVCAASMVVGNLLGLRETRVKRILAYSSIAHVGYLVLGYLSVHAVAGAALSGTGALLFYVIAYGLSVLGAFLTVSALRPEGVVTLNDLHGGARRHPLLAACMLIFVISLAGLPISIGFWGKLYLFSAAFHAGYVKLALLGLAGSAIGLFYYMRIIVHLFMVAPDTGERGVPESSGLQEGVLVVTAATVLLLGFFPDALSRWFLF